MSRRPIPIARHERLRALLTDVLPFEVPLFFSNVGLYDWLRRTDLSSTPYLIRVILEAGGTKPFQFEIERGEGKTRTLSIMHPSVQRRVCSFYKDFDGLILNLCARSAFSLRFPSRIGSHFFETQFADEDLDPAEVGDLDPANFASQRMGASTYFYYQRYTAVWRFFDSTEFRRLEERFRVMLKLDISKCFDSIYTHSISWAVKSRSYSKVNRERFAFDSQFDDLMQAANWGETNGILIGPEVSRVFAEIVLQAVDASVEREIRVRGLAAPRIEIRRYVDDYYVFADTHQAALDVKKIVEQALGHLKLSLNEAKTELLDSPLMTSLSIARGELSRALGREFVRLLKIERRASSEATGGLDSPLPTDTHVSVEVPLVRTLRDPIGTADRIIRRIKSIAKAHGVTYSAIAPYCLKLIERHVGVWSKAIAGSSVNTDACYSLLSCALEVASFLFRMDVRVGTSHGYARILLLIERTSLDWKNAHALLVQECFDHCLSILRQLHHRGKMGPETVDLVALIANFATSGAGTADGKRNLDSLSADEVLRLLGFVEGTFAEANYFQLMGALAIARNEARYEEVNRVVAREIRLRFADLPKNAHEHTETVLMFFDVLSCPWLATSLKVEVVQAMGAAALNRVLPEADARFVINSAKGLSFTAWDEPLDLDLVLRRRALRPAYDG